MFSSPFWCVLVFPYSNIGRFQSSVLFHSNDLYFQYFMFQIRIWSVWEILFVRKAHKFVFPSHFRSVSVFTNSNLVYIHVNSDDSKDLFLMFLLPVTSGPRFRCVMKSGCRPFRVRSGPFRYFLTQTSDVFNSVLVHRNDW